MVDVGAFCEAMRPIQKEPIHAPLTILRIRPTFQAIRLALRARFFLYLKALRTRTDAMLENLAPMPLLAVRACLLALRARKRRRHFRARFQFSIIADVEPIAALGAGFW